MAESEDNKPDKVDRRIGNEFWKLRSKHGADKLFKSPELLWDAACEYFQWCVDNPIYAQENKGTKNVNEVEFRRPFTMKGFCLFCGASEHWYSNFKAALKDDDDKDFLYICRRIEDNIYNQKFEGATIGIYNANIIARDLGLSEKSQVQQNSTIEYVNVSKQFPEE